MKKLFLLFILSVGSLFSWTSNESAPPETLSSKLQKRFSAQELYTMMQKELELYAENKEIYPLITQWHTHPVLYSVLREYTIEKETYDFNKNLESNRKYVEGNEVYGETLEERIQRRLEKDERKLNRLLQLTFIIVTRITAEINTNDLIAYITQHEIHKDLLSGYESIFKGLKTLQSKLYGDWETYIQNLLTLYDGGCSFADVYGYRTEELFAESGDPRCIEKLELAVKSGDSSYSSNLEIGKFLVANGGATTENVIEKALDYPHDRVRIWGAKKICEMKIKRLYPRVRDLYNRSLIVGSVKFYIAEVLARTIKDFPYWIPPYGQTKCGFEGECRPIPEGALPLDGL